MKAELARMDKDNFDITSPIFMEITQQDCDNAHKTMQEFINNCLAELCDNDLDIIDYGINYLSNGTKVGYIKYNRR